MVKGKLALFILTLCSSIYYADSHPLNNYLAINKFMQGGQDLSLSNPHEIRLEHLHLELTVSFEKQTLNGFCEWNFTSIVKTKQVIFDVEKIEVEKVEVDGKAAKWQLTPSPAWHSSALSIDIKPSSRKVRIYYKTSPDAAALQWLGPQQTKSGEPFLYTQSQAILARTWVPCFDRPDVRFTYSATIRTPKHLIALMSAENPKSTNAEGVYHFKMEQKIPSYLLALAVGQLAFRELDERTGIYSEYELIDVTVREFASLPQMVKTAENLYGPYRWQRYDLLFLPPSFPFGGMENPRLTFATPTIIAGDGSLVSLVAHELAHSWSGNLVTNSSWLDFWLNEGFTVYFENRIMEAMYGKDYADMLKVLGYGDLSNTLEELGDTNELTRLELTGSNRDPDEAMTDIAYEKGRFFLNHIESVVGREKFDAFLRDYFNKHAFGNLTTADFRAFLYAGLVNGDSAVAKAINFDVWTKGRGLPPGFVVPVSSEFNKVDSLRPLILAGDTLAVEATRTWTTHHWLYFIRNLDTNIALMPVVDGFFHFTNTDNSEIAFEWFMLSIKTGYYRSYSKMEKFLETVGRRKFVKPLFTALAEKDNDSRAYAFDLYLRVRPKYHAVTVGSIDEIFGYKP